MTTDSAGPKKSSRGKRFGADRSRIEIVGDIISPTGVEWEAEHDPDRVLNPPETSPSQDGESTLPSNSPLDED